MRAIFSPKKMCKELNIYTQRNNNKKKMVPQMYIEHPTHFTNITIYIYLVLPLIIQHHKVLTKP